MATLSITIDWAALHMAAKAVDQARRQMPYSYVDPFGGTYTPCRYEDHGLVGLADLRRAAESFRSDAWEAIHKAAETLRTAAQPTDSDYVTICWSVGCDGRADMRHKSHRGAAWRASRFGGRVEVRRELDTRRVERRKAAVLQRVRSAAATAIAVHGLFVELARAGIDDYHAERTICGIHAGRINLTGLRWLSGAAYERDGGVPVDDVMAFAAGADVDFSAI